MKDGGRVFPIIVENVDNVMEAGITLRNYFAAKAMQALISDAAFRISPSMCSETAYTMADAMLKEGEK